MTAPTCARCLWACVCPCCICMYLKWLRVRVRVIDHFDLFSVWHSNVCNFFWPSLCGSQNWIIWTVWKFLYFNDFFFFSFLMEVQVWSSLILICENYAPKQSSKRSKTRYQISNCSNLVFSFPTIKSFVFLLVLISISNLNIHGLNPSIPNYWIFKKKLFNYQCIAKSLVTQLTGDTF